MFPSSANATSVQDYQTRLSYTSNTVSRPYTTQQRRAFNTTRTFNTTRLNATKATSILTGFGWLEWFSTGPDGPVIETGPNSLKGQCTEAPDRRQYRANPLTGPMHYGHATSRRDRATSIQGQPISPPASCGK